MMCLRRNQSIANCKEIIFNNAQLRLNFHSCNSTKTFSKEAKTCLDEAWKLIFSKTNHSMLGAEFKKIREKHTSHYSKTSSKEALRDNLKHQSKSKMR